MPFLAPLTPDFCLRLTLTLLHFLWQGVAIALFAAGIGMMIRERSATARYVVFSAALLLMACCLPITYALLDVPRLEIGSNIDASHDPISAAVSAPAHPNLASESPAPAVIPHIQSRPPLQNTPTPNATPPRDPLAATFLSKVAERTAPWIASAYLLGVLLMFLRLLIGLQGGRRLCALSRPLEDPFLLALVQRTARSLRLRMMPAVAWCSHVAAPTVVGIARPVILLPFCISSGLTPVQIEMLLLHELAHLRRHDPWINLLQCTIETVLFFHPAVWWVSRRMRAEREIACDDMVLTSGFEHRRYAESLLRMAEMTQAQPLTQSTFALSAEGPCRSAFAARVLRLIDPGAAAAHVRPARVWPMALLLGATFALTCFAFLGNQAVGSLRSSVAGRLGAIAEEIGSGMTRFGNGVQAEVVGVAYYPNISEEIWRYDGRLASNIPAELKTSDPPVIDPPTQNSREVFVVFSGLPQGQNPILASETGEVTPALNVVYKGDKILCSFIADFGDNPSGALRLGMAMGPWRIAQQVRHGAAQIRTGGRGSSDDELTFGASIDRPGRSEITLTGKLDEKLQNKVIAIDQDGTEHLSHRSRRSYHENLEQNTYYFKLPKRAKIMRYELRTRPFELRNITDLALEPVAQNTTASLKTPSAG